MRILEIFHGLRPGEWLEVKARAKPSGRRSAGLGPSSSVLVMVGDNEATACRSIETALQKMRASAADE